MAAHNSVSVSKIVDHMDPIWYSVRAEAETAALNEPLLAAFLYSTVLNQSSLEEAVMHRISERLGHADVAADLLRQTFVTMSNASSEWSQILQPDEYQFGKSTMNGFADNKQNPCALLSIANALSDGFE